MHLFKPIKLKKRFIVWYTYKWAGILEVNSQPTKKIGHKIVQGEKHEAMTQPLWYWPYGLQIIKCGKKNFAMGVCGNMVKDLYHLRIWKKDNIILTLRFHKRGNIIEGWKKYGIDKKPKNYPQCYLKGKTNGR